MTLFSVYLSIHLHVCIYLYVTCTYIPFSVAFWLKSSFRPGPPQHLKVLLSLKDKSREIWKKKTLSNMKEINVKFYLAYKKTGHVIDSKVMLSDFEASEKLFSDNQKYYIEVKTI